MDLIDVQEPLEFLTDQESLYTIQDAFNRADDIIKLLSVLIILIAVIFIYDFIVNLRK